MTDLEVHQLEEIQVKRLVEHPQHNATRKVGGDPTGTESTKQETMKHRIS